MAVGSAVAIYFVIWWVALFAVLPWGVRSQIESDTVVAGSDPGAPTRTPLMRIVVANTILSTVIFAVFYVVWTRGLITMDDLSFLPGAGR